MKKLSVFVVFLASFIISSSASALSPVVSIAQLGGAGSGTSQQEFFQIYNNSNEDIDVTNWCVVSNETTNLACFVPPSQNVKLFFESKRSILIGSSQFLAANPVVTLDYTYTTSNIPATNGSIKIVDAHTNAIDHLGWGSGTAEGVPMPGNLTGGKVYKRISSDNVTLQDTNNNAVDFTVSDMPSQLSGGGIYEQESIIDICANIDGVQTSLPEGFIQNGNNCDPIDVCPNIAGPQTQIPIGFMQDSDGNCFEDICDNLEGLQKTLPDGYYNSGVDCHIIELKLSELLPNVSGYDTGKEYVEVVNPTPYTTSLVGYSLQLGTKIVALADVTIGGNQYSALSDTQTGIILPNTSAIVKLIGPDGTVLDESVAYQNPQDDMAWALIDGVWQYTDTPTPNAENTPLQEPGMGGGSDGTSSLAPCAANQYRSPDTNRCRLIVSSAQTPCDAGEERNPATGRCRSIFSTSSLTPCQPGQTRNPETNRCRSTVSPASAGLVPCKAGEERNPATNRCRKIATSSSLTPCPPGQERNPETNRCRKSAASAVLAEVKDNPTPRTSDGFGWILAGGAMASLGGYGVWEWRREIISGFSRLLGIFGKSPPEL